MQRDHQSFLFGLFFGLGGALAVKLASSRGQPEDSHVPQKVSDDTSREVHTVDTQSGGDATNSSDFLQAGRQFLQFIVHYRTSVAPASPVISRVEPNYLAKALPPQLPDGAEPWSNIMSDMSTLIVPGLTNWETPSKFFAYFKPHASYPAVLGELVCAGLNVMGFDWIASPACTELEVVVLDWLAKFLNLPDRFLNLSPHSGGSVIQGSAGEAAIVAFLAALTRKQQEYESEGLPKPSRENMVVFASDQAHAIIKKACMVLGIGHFCEIPTKEEDNFSINPSALRSAIEQEMAIGRVPIVVVGTTGTTSSCAFDSLTSISTVVKGISKLKSIWFHVDAAYGGAYACLPQLQHLFDGLNEVDSLVVNCHKKLLCPFDLAAMYVADRKPILAALSLQPEYLRNSASESGAVVDYEHWQLPLGRRFRSLKLWFVLRRFGRVGLMKHLQQGLDLSSYFASLMSRHPDIFELGAPVSLSLVCFRLVGCDNESHKHYLELVKSTGECFIIHTKLGDKIVLRFACGGIEQSKSDIDKGFAVLLRVANEKRHEFKTE